MVKFLRFSSQILWKTKQRHAIIQDVVEITDHTFGELSSVVYIFNDCKVGFNDRVRNLCFCVALFFKDVTRGTEKLYDRKQRENNF